MYKGRKVLPVMHSDLIFFIPVNKCVHSIGYIVRRQALILEWKIHMPGTLSTHISYEFSTQYSQQTLTWIQFCRAMTPIVSTDLLVSHKFFKIPALLFL